MALAMKTHFRAAFDLQKAAVEPNDCSVCDLPGALGEKCAFEIPILRLPEQLIHAWLDVGFVDVANGTGRGLHELDDICAAGQIPGWPTQAAVTADQPMSRVTVFVAIDECLQKASSQGASLSQVDRRHRHAAYRDSAARKQPLHGQRIEPGYAGVTNDGNTVCCTNFAGHQTKGQQGL